MAQSFAEEKMGKISKWGLARDRRIYRRAAKVGWNLSW
jgi:hypothetical protein